MLELNKLMIVLNKAKDTRDEIVSTKKLLSITPEDICRYMNLKAYGKEQPEENDLPVKGRSNTLRAIKKKMSYFMPRKNNVWDDIRK